MEKELTQEQIKALISQNIALKEVQELQNEAVFRHQLLLAINRNTEAMSELMNLLKENLSSEEEVEQEPPRKEVTTPKEVKKILAAEPEEDEEEEDEEEDEDYEPYVPKKNYKGK